MRFIGHSLRDGLYLGCVVRARTDELGEDGRDHHEHEQRTNYQFCTT